MNAAYKATEQSIKDLLQQADDKACLGDYRGATYRLTQAVETALSLVRSVASQGEESGRV